MARDFRERILDDLERSLGIEGGLNVEKGGREMVVLLRDAKNKKDTDRKQIVSANWCDLGLQVKGLSRFFLYPVAIAQLTLHLS